MGNFKSLTVNGKSLLDWLHPVGSVYLSFNSTNPKDIFGGGTWEEIATSSETGRFLYI